METFARPKARLAFVMPRSILTTDQHQNLIQRKYSAKFRLTGYWDLWDVQPLFNVPSCVLFAEQSSNIGTAKDSIPAEIWSGQLSQRDQPWASISGRFSVQKAQAGVIWLGNRSALSTVAGAKTPTRSSSYAKAFKQGATIVPRNFYFVTVDGLEGTPDPDRLYYARTNEESALDSKPPYRDARLHGHVEGRFIFSTSISRHVLPFCLLEPAPVLLPLEESNGSYYTVTNAALKRKGYREFARWMEQAEVIWKEKRGSKSAGQTVLERLDYQKGLSAQALTHRHLVLYNAAGTNLSAAYCDRNTLNLKLLVEHKLYWAAFSSSADECHFLTAVLNSSVVNEMIKPFQSTGLLGERDIEKKVLDVSIPRFEGSSLLHRKLCERSRLAHLRVQNLLNDSNFPAGESLARQRRYVRSDVVSYLSDIDELVKTLLNHNG